MRGWENAVKNIKEKELGSLKSKALGLRGPLRYPFASRSHCDLVSTRAFLPAMCNATALTGLFL